MLALFFQAKNPVCRDRALEPLQSQLTNWLRLEDVFYAQEKPLADQYLVGLGLVAEAGG